MENGKSNKMKNDSELAWRIKMCCQDNVIYNNYFRIKVEDLRGIFSISEIAKCRV